MSIKLITRGLMFIVGLMMLQAARSGGQNSIAYSASETVTADGDRCIDLFSRPDLVLACFVGVAHAISTDTLKSKFLEAYGQYFSENKHHAEANIAIALSGFYQESARLNQSREVDSLRSEIKRLEEANEHSRILNLLFKFKDSELSSMRAVIDETVIRLEAYARAKLDCATYAHDIVSAYQILTQIYSLTDNFYCKLEITTQAINLIISHDATERFLSQFEYFQKQQKLAQEGMDKQRSLFTQGKCAK
ncbi:MAG: hypothetical protein KBD83_01995 [Gammaproteobacteria bacterium]|nr:hypothetical protein [Gammaproteobacteria bacterium]